MNLKLIIIYLAILWIPALSTIGLFSVLNTVQPTLGGFDILSLTKLSLYVILPIIYISTILLSIFKFKVKFDTDTALIILIAGYILTLSTLIALRSFLFSGLSEVSISGLGSTAWQAISIGAQYAIIFRNIILIQSFYLSYLFSIFLSQLVDRRLAKILVYVFGGAAIFFILGFLGVFVFSLFG